MHPYYNNNSINFWHWLFLIQNVQHKSVLAQMRFNRTSSHLHTCSFKYPRILIKGCSRGRSCDLAVRQMHLWVNHPLHAVFFFFLSLSLPSLCISFSFPLEKVSRSFYKLIKIWCCMKPIWLWTGAYWSHRWSRDQHFKRNELFQRRVWNGRRTLIRKPHQPTKPTQRVIRQRQWPHFVFHLF